MMTYTTYDPDVLEQWCLDETNAQLLEDALQAFLQVFAELFHAKSQKKYFTTMIQG